MGLLSLQVVRSRFCSGSDLCPFHPDVCVCMFLMMFCFVLFCYFGQAAVCTWEQKAHFLMECPGFLPGAHLPVWLNLKRDQTVHAHFREQVKPGAAMERFTSKSDCQTKALTLAFFLSVEVPPYKPVLEGKKSPVVLERSWQGFLRSGCAMQVKAKSVGHSCIHPLYEKPGRTFLSIHKT